MASSSTKSNGVGFTGMLTLVFITLKLIGKIDWSWWWVLSPIWVSFLLVAIVIVFVAVVALFVAALKK